MDTPKGAMTIARNTDARLQWSYDRCSTIDVRLRR